MQVSVLNDRYDSGKYGSPRYFDVAWSETGNMNADADWTYIASYTVPDMHAGPPRRATGSMRAGNPST